METNVLDWLEATAAACPDKPAFLDENSAVTFADVRREARIIGTAAAKFRAGQKRPIAVMSGRNAHTPAVFLGAVYAGCCYAPMDGTMPVHRLNSILNTLDTDLMIVQRAFYDKAKTLDFSGTILIAEELLAGSEDAALLADCRARARELDPLYIIFTSGSTGTPKGVITAQHSLMCYIEDYAGVMGIARADVLGNQSPLDYIAAVRDIYLPLRFGATTAIIPKELFMSPERLFEYMNDKGVTAVGWSVSALTVPAALGAFECSAPQPAQGVLLRLGDAVQLPAPVAARAAGGPVRQPVRPDGGDRLVHVLRCARSGRGHRRAADRQAVPALRGVSALGAQRGRARRRDRRDLRQGPHPRAGLLQQPRENGRELPAKPAQPRIR